MGLFGLGENQQVADGAAHAVELVDHDRHGSVPLGGVVAEHFEMTAGDRDGCSKVVGDVVEELTLGAGAAVEAVDHLVERAAELGELAVAVDRDARRQIGVGDRPRGAGELAHRSDDTTGEPPGKQRS